tara:strand:+ start:454 stop:1233 length:780 start_codon:yes stop_codon:yes gene_type:complete
MSLEKGTSVQGGAGKTEEKPDLSKIEALELKLEKALKAIAQPQAPAGGITAEQMEKILSKVTSSNGVDTSIVGDYNYVEEADIDPEDLLENGHVFFSHTAGYIIVDDLKQGRSVRTPYNTIIEFKYVHTQKKQHGKEVELNVLSSYLCRSKKEVEWLKKSSFYGYKIFDDISLATSKQAKVAGKISQYMQAAKSMEIGQLINACKEYQIPVTRDPEIMRLALSTAYAQKSVIQENENLENANKNKLIQQSIINEVLKTT